jgi:phytoene dehydrogenase-like protein
MMGQIDVYKVLLVLLVVNVVSWRVRKASAFGFHLQPAQSRPVLESSKAGSSVQLHVERKRVVVVGGGVGGLATAARIASSCGPSFHVTVLEKNAQVGGRSGSFDVEVPNVGTFRHELGPSLLLLPHVYQELFQDCSRKAEDFGLIMRQCIPAYQVVFDDGDTIKLGFPERPTSLANNDAVKEQTKEARRKMDAMEPNGAAKWDEYMRATAAFLDCGLSNFIEERLDLGSFPAFIWEALRDYGKVRVRR